LMSKHTIGNLDVEGIPPLPPAPASRSTDRPLLKTGIGCMRASSCPKSLQLFEIMPLRLQQRAKLANVRHAFKSKYSLNELGACLGT
jgi:hypothetical protein